MFYVKLFCIALLLSVSYIDSNGFTIPQGDDVNAMDDLDTCLDPQCVIAAADILKKIDESVDPCEDFYQFACGGFINLTVIPDEEKSVGQFSLIEDELDKDLRLIVQEPITSEDPLTFKLIKTLYSSCMDIETIKQLDVAPMMDLIDRLGKWPLLSDDWNEQNFSVFDLNFKLNGIGLGFSQFISLDVMPDLKNSTVRVITFDQCSLSLDQKYLLKGLNDTTIKAYYKYMVDIAEALGANRKTAETDMMDLLKFEIQLAEISTPKEERRDYQALYRNSTIKQLQQTYPKIPWLDCVNNFTNPVHNITDEEPITFFAADTFINNMTHLLETVPKRTLANYLFWRGVASMIRHMPDRFRKMQLTLAKVIKGTTSEKPRWKECMELVTGSMTTATGALYVRRYFDEDAKGAARSMEAIIRKEFEGHLKDIDWMDDKTKERAKEKSKVIRSHIGYPEELLNDTILATVHEGLELHPQKFFENALHLSQFNHISSMKKLRKPVDKNDWEEHSGSAAVNAYYNIVENSIEFPAGILQGVFFGKDRPHYLNFGGIGFVIGHEMTHGFDDMGRQFDQDGNLIPWWEGDTEKKFKSRVQCVIDQYENYSIPNTDLRLSGINTQGENIADIGGIKWAYNAYQKWVSDNKPEKKLPGLKYSPQQLFWLSFANVLCEKIRPEALKLNVLTGRHSPARYRVIGSVSNNPSFVEDFHCSKDSKMNRVNKCEVW